VPSFFINQIEYKKKHFTCDVPINYPVGESLGQWVRNQRDMYNEGTLDEERANYLTEQGVDFDLALPKIPFNGDELWDEKMQELVSMTIFHSSTLTSFYIFGET